MYDAIGYVDILYMYVGCPLETSRLLEHPYWFFVEWQAKRDRAI